MIDEILSKEWLHGRSHEMGDLTSPFPVITTKLAQMTDVVCLAWDVLATCYPCLVNMHANVCFLIFPS